MPSPSHDQEVRIPEEVKRLRPTYQRGPIQAFMTPDPAGPYFAVSDLPRIREAVLEEAREAVYQVLTGQYMPDHELIAYLDRADAALKGESRG